MVKNLQYIALIGISIATAYSIYIGSSFTINGILGIVFFASLVLKEKYGQNKFLEITFMISSIGILLSFIFSSFIK